MSQSSLNLRGELGWKAEYTRQFGATRWKTLYKALKEPAASSTQVCLLNPWLGSKEQEKVAQEKGLIPYIQQSQTQTKNDDDANSGVTVQSKGVNQNLLSQFALKGTWIVAGNGNSKNSKNSEASKIKSDSDSESLKVTSSESDQSCQNSNATQIKTVTVESSDGLNTPTNVTPSPYAPEPDSNAITNSKAQVETPSTQADDNVEDSSFESENRLDSEVVPSFMLGSKALLAGNESVTVNAMFAGTRRVRDAAARDAISTMNIDEDTGRIVPQLKEYYLDAASVVCARMVLDDLVTNSSESNSYGTVSNQSIKVLDLCASPGGKSLVLATMMFPTGNSIIVQNQGLNLSQNSQSLLVANEFSPDRFRRLRTTLSDYIPHNYISSDSGGFSNVKCTNVDGTDPRSVYSSELYKLGPYDRILVDAPCSTDRHLIERGNSEGKNELSKWSIKSVQANSDRQLHLLWQALWLLRGDGKGYLVYSTCALNRRENEGVIDRLQDAVKLVSSNGKEKDKCIEFEIIKTKFFLPDHDDESHGIKGGPLFCCKLRKKKGPVGMAPPLPAKALKPKN